jgi:hypothetical protein
MMDLLPKNVSFAPEIALDSPRSAIGQHPRGEFGHASTRKMVAERKIDRLAEASLIEARLPRWQGHHAAQLQHIPYICHLNPIA